MRRASRVIASLPESMASSRRSFANHCLILVLARGEATKASQSRLGPADSAFEVKLRDVEDDQVGGYKLKPAELAQRAKLFPGRWVMMMMRSLM